jgi:toxin ParE1/3/4
MGSVKKFPSAQRDLVEIGDYIARDSPANADRFLEAIEKECQKLADSPIVLGKRCEGLHPDLRRYNFKRYAIIYRPVPEGIELVGVFHGSRDLEAMFERLNERVRARSSSSGARDRKKGE